VLIAADDALKSASDAGAAGHWTSNKVDKKFEDAIHLLSGFEDDFTFPSKDPTSDPNISGTVTRETKLSDTILYALEKNMHAKVKFTSVSLSLNADEF
jgi:hypothetical protein